MTIIRAASVKCESNTPAALGQYTAKLFSDTGGLTQFGAFVETLAPGARSSFRHWHQNEDEMIYMLNGTVTAHEGAISTALRPGDAATYRAGDPIGHYLENTSTEDASYLVIGTRARSDIITYPDHDRVLHFDRETTARKYFTTDGEPADPPKD
ncbi:cupin domain-containing protein [Loktanella sp. S4079]|uniref:cupin domain-containing protein n=1 Tax=Loktanella sp. S4079 TaxID=579483 RepID=UPI0005FA486C|nr:cupin domain-containing protein [Loktanella sp. S4079]KJZ19708.1 cupin [Loktanella sp. S4079]